MNNYSAIAKWVYFTFNYPDPLKMLTEIYGDFLGRHFYGKWIQYEHDFNRLFCEMTSGNQKKLMEYVMNMKGLIDENKYE